MAINRSNLAYVIGVAIGDGNLSNPNGRAVRLRITCDKKYPKLAIDIKKSLEKLMPQNSVSFINRAERFMDISCYSNQWPYLLGWDPGDKYKQRVSIPTWVKSNKRYLAKCIKGLIQTDGSIYHDRGYKMVNFVTTIPKLAEDFEAGVKKLGFNARSYKLLQDNKRTRYNIRISKDVNKFIQTISLSKF